MIRLFNYICFLLLFIVAYSIVAYYFNLPNYEGIGYWAILILVVISLIIATYENLVGPINLFFHEILTNLSFLNSSSGLKDYINYIYFPILISILLVYFKISILDYLEITKDIKESFVVYFISFSINLLAIFWVWDSLAIQCLKKFKNEKFSIILIFKTYFNDPISITLLAGTTFLATLFLSCIVIFGTLFASFFILILLSLPIKIFLGLNLDNLFDVVGPYYIIFMLVFWLIGLYLFLLHASLKTYIGYVYNEKQ